MTPERIIALGGAIAIIFSGYNWLVNLHDPKGSAAAVQTGTMMVLESQNQNIVNEYKKRIRECEKEGANCSDEYVEDAEAQLERLKWDRQYIEMVKKGSN